MTPAQFRNQHGDSDTWSAADFESYEHLVEAADPDLTRATRDRLIIIGRHVHGGRVVVGLATVPLLAA
ncbi:hypothetical protein AB8O64_36830 (plasmid) [Streptomyces sp. QH1-20]|uniref:hypothetical protein n=1 Tax=Streptomyces sp. QH1-20 TaxID=3240934 RepID=UPI0035136AE5